MRLFALFSFTIIYIALCASLYPSMDADETAKNVVSSYAGYIFNCKTERAIDRCPVDTVFKFDFSKIPCIAANACRLRFSFENYDDEANSLDVNADILFHKGNNQFSFVSGVFADYTKYGTSISLKARSEFSQFIIRIYRNDVAVVAAFLDNMAAYGIAIPGNNDAWTTVTDIDISKYIKDSDDKVVSSDNVSYSMFFDTDTDVIVLYIGFQDNGKLMIGDVLKDLAPSVYNTPQRAISYIETRNDVAMEYEVYLGGEWDVLESFNAHVGDKKGSVISNLSINGTLMDVNKANILPHSTFITGSTLTMDFSNIQCVIDKSCYLRLDSNGANVDVEYVGTSTTFNTSSNHAIDYQSNTSTIKVTMNDSAYSLAVGIYDNTALILQEIRRNVYSSISVFDFNKPETFTRAGSVDEKFIVDISSNVASGTVSSYIQEDGIIFKISTGAAEFDLQAILAAVAPDFKPKQVSLVSIDVEENSETHTTAIIDGNWSIFSELDFSDEDGGMIARIIKGDVNKTQTLAEFIGENRTFVLGGLAVFTMLIISAVCMCCCNDKEQVVMVPGGGPMMVPPTGPMMGSPNLGNNMMMNQRPQQQNHMMNQGQQQNPMNHGGQNNMNMNRGNPNANTVNSFSNPMMAPSSMRGNGPMNPGNPRQMGIMPSAQPGQL